MMQGNLDLSSPWVRFANECAALFEGDHEVTCDYTGGEEPKLTVRVENASKADAVAVLLGDGRRFDNVTLKIEVIPANEGATQADLIRRAFQGNPLFADVEEVAVPGGVATYASFMPEVVQWRADSIQSMWGIETVAAEDVARDVLALEPDTFCCTVLAEDD